MRVLVAEDDAVSRRILETHLRRWDFEVTSTMNGTEAWSVLQQEDAPSLAILDVMMPGLDGLEICRRLRSSTAAIRPYVILLTAMNGPAHVVNGIEAGADDYLTKPYDRDELRARVQVGVRTIDLQTKLASRVSELENALTHIKQLQGILPICCYCKKVRDDQDYWQTIEKYIGDRSEAAFSHGICPGCYETTVQEDLQSFLASQPPRSNSTI